MAEKKLSEVIKNYSQHLADARRGSVSGIPINTMSADDLVALVGWLNHLCHNQQERLHHYMRKNGGVAGGVITPPGFRPKT